MNGGLETGRLSLKLVTSLVMSLHVTPASGRLPSQQQTNAPGLGPQLVEVDCLQDGVFILGVGGRSQLFEFHQFKSCFLYIIQYNLGLAGSCT